ncbi:uncharacterized protein LOC126825411 [Patella vulgata]|uniref:uncharacterized protein LOC126825411 n=1 Tax=Patella vulgata TaxID=6465 RepID=UPI00217F3FE5|nr:uncharacterized protein LOC126825411 [Patella vulgata]
MLVHLHLPLVNLQAHSLKYYNKKGVKVVSLSVLIFYSPQKSKQTSQNLKVSQHKSLVFNPQRQQSLVVVKNLVELKKKVDKIIEFLKSRTTHLYCIFGNSVIPIFEIANKLLQSEKPCIHILLPTLEKLFKDLLTRFVKPSVVNKSSSLLEINFEDVINQKDDGDLYIGADSRKFIEDNPGMDLKPFYSAIRHYFTTVCNHMKKKFPLQDKVLLNAVVTDISKRDSVKFSSLKFFVNKSVCLTKLVDGKMNELVGQFLAYQVDDLGDSIMKEDRIDKAWHTIGQMKDPDTGNFKYPLLLKVVMLILVIFHSNADCERAFSMVTKVKTKFRPNMSTEALNAVITHKIAMQNDKSPAEAFFTNTKRG